MSGASSPWLAVILLMLAEFSTRFTEGATPEEIQSLRAAASELGISPGTWNFSTDPCVAGWKGISCCTETSTRACCTFSSQVYLPQTPCDRSADARVWMLILRSDLFGQTLEGTFPDALCNLTSLRVLDIGRHHLRGPVHGCIGNRLSNLVSLRIGDNYFNGSIPEELGNLSNLQELFFDVTSVSGSIPASLGKLGSLVNLNLRSNQLEGEIPGEIGQLSSLTTLELQVNKLTGRIPVSFASLTLLTTLNLFNNQLYGELNASTLQGMSSLTTLDLRRNNFTGLVPGFSNSRLRELNLGFNQLSGSLPDIAPPGSLTNLFLSHNRLSGSIPAGFSSFSLLLRLDLSHNLLSGSLQSVAGLGATTVQGPLQLDVSFNFLDISTGPLSIQSQRQPASNPFFNCNTSSSCSRSSPGTDMFFAVNSGGSSVTGISDTGVEIRFADDTQTSLNNQSVGFFYGTGPWALELSGEQAGAYSLHAPVNLTGAGSGSSASQELYSSMRWCDTYIAYYGYGLKPGIYTVTLHFAELVFSEPGYRIFDVILQGEVLKKDLDIVREVGPRAAYRIISNNVTVRDGSVSVELLHSRPDRFLPAGDWPVETTGPVISGISVVSVDYTGEPGDSKLSSGQIAGISVASGVFGILALVVACVLIRRKKNTRKSGQQLVYSSGGPSQPGSTETSLDVGGAMTYQELFEATNGFSQKIGEGGFGAVYKGTLPSGTVVAVKQLVKHTPQIQEDFKKEISIISKVRHRNLLAVIGYSLESDIPMLVCEFIPNGSLDRWIFRRQENVLSWDVRRKIAVGVACGLAYLHDESSYRIIHCDVKPANILLDSDFSPRLADFGLARLYDEKHSHVTATRLKGTAGYLAPEYAMHLQLSDKVDVYSFGVVLLELLSGRHAVDLAAPSAQIVLVDWAHTEAQIPSNMLDIMDPRLHGKYPEEEARDMATIAILCTQKSASLRPKMQAVWLMLNGTIKVPEFLENLNAVIQSGTSDPESSGSMGELYSQGFTSLRIFPGSNSGLSDSSKALSH